MHFDSTDSLFDNLLPHARQERLDAEVNHASPRVVGVSRSVAFFGALLLLLILAELATIPLISKTIGWHIAIGLVILPALLIKIGINGYRAIAYYRQSPAFLEAGAPWLPLRLLSLPFLVTTLIVFGSGVEMTFAGPSSFSLTFLDAAHILFSIIWLLLFGFHVIAYANRSMRSAGRDLAAIPARGADPSRARLRTLAALIAIAFGIALAIQFQSPIARWERAFAAPAAVGPLQSHPAPAYYSAQSLQHGRARIAEHLKISRKLQSQG